MYHSPYMDYIESPDFIILAFKYHCNAAGSPYKLSNAEIYIVYYVLAYGAQWTIKCPNGKRQEIKRSSCENDFGLR
jgi:hypothetical protein